LRREFEDGIACEKPNKQARLIDGYLEDSLYIAICTPASYKDSPFVRGSECIGINKKPVANNYHGSF
jgi:hypothetical protein